MNVNNTPVEDYRAEYGLLVKREDLCCPSGPHFAKTRGVYAHVAARPEKIIGVLDTYHSQAGWAVAQACKDLGKLCVNFFPIRKADRDKPIQPQQIAAIRLGARVEPLQAGRSAVLYHAAKARLRSIAEDIYPGASSYMMPNALKLPEMVTETAVEVHRTFASTFFDEPANQPDNILIAISSGTIAAGVINGIESLGFNDSRPNYLLHMGYSRSHEKTLDYIAKMAGVDVRERIILIDEGWAYGDEADGDNRPPFPSNKYYDLKAFQWWLDLGRYHVDSPTLFWNIG